MAINSRASQTGRVYVVLLLCGIAAIVALVFLTADPSVPTAPVAVDTSDATDDIVDTRQLPAPQTDIEPDNTNAQNELVFLDEAFMTLSRWQPETVRPLLAPATAQAVDDEQLGNVLGVLQARLGGLVSYETPRATLVSTAAAAGVPVESLRSYGFVAHYTEGDAQVNLVLQTLGDDVGLYNFDIQAGDNTSLVRRD